MFNVLIDWPGDIPIALGLLGMVAIYFSVVAIAIRIAPRPKARVAEYQPPPNVSPALAAYLMENGRAERAFAAALISLACKSFLRIHEKADGVVLERLPKPDQPLAPEEAGLLSRVLPDSQNSYSFNGADCDELCHAYAGFKGDVREIASAELASEHLWFWGPGVVVCFAALIFAGMTFPILDGFHAILGAMYALAWVTVGLRCLLAAERTWRVTIKKLFSYIPGRDVPRRPFNVNDAVPFFLTSTAFFGFVLLIYLASLQFALILNAALAILVAARYFLVVPTEEGRAVLMHLRNYSEYLSRVEADRMTRENAPGKAPVQLEQGSAYAIALRVERGWGEDFAENIVEILESDAGYNWHMWKISPTATLRDGENDVIQLNLGGRRRL